MHTYKTPLATKPNKDAGHRTTLGWNNVMKCAFEAVLMARESQGNMQYVTVMAHACPEDGGWRNRKKSAN